MAVLALLLSLTFAQAQGPRGGGPADRTPEEIAERQTKAMTEHLELDEAQVTKIKEVNLAFAQKMKANRDQADKEREAMRETAEGTRKEHAEALKNVLTEEQFQKWESAREGRGPDARKGKGGDRSPRGKGRGPRH